jgi:hypothetical protein
LILLKEDILGKLKIILRGTDGHVGGEEVNNVVNKNAIKA